MSKQAPTFSRPPMARELMTKETRDRFDQLSSKSRALIKNVIDLDDVNKALRLAGFTGLGQVNANSKSVHSLMDQTGITPEFLMTCLKECCEASVIKLDKSGNPHVTVDFVSRLRALDLSFKLRNMYSAEVATKNTEKSIMELFKDTEVPKEIDTDERKDLTTDQAPS